MACQRFLSSSKTCEDSVHRTWNIRKTHNSNIQDNPCSYPLTSNDSTFKFLFCLISLIFKERQKGYGGMLQQIYSLMFSCKWTCTVAKLFLFTKIQLSRFIFVPKGNFKLCFLSCSWGFLQHEKTAVVQTVQSASALCNKHCLRPKISLSCLELSYSSLLQD